MEEEPKQRPTRDSLRIAAFAAAALVAAVAGVLRGPAGGEKPVQKASSPGTAASASVDPGRPASAPTP
jgi:hypothetical protein